MRKKILCRKPRINNCSNSINKKWFIDYACPDPTPPYNGKLHRVRDYKGLHKFKTVAERTAAAEQKCKKIEAKLRAGWNPWIDGDNDKYIFVDQLQNHHNKRYGVNTVTKNNFNFYASKLLDEKKQNLSNETITTYRSRLRIFSNFIASKGFDNQNVSAIDNNTISEFFNWLINHEKVSNYTVKKYFQILHKVFADVENHLGTKNPMHICPTSPHKNNNAPVAIPKCDLDIVIEKLKEEPQLYLFVRFMHNCFLRPGKEIRLMKIGWIDFERGLINVPEAFCKTKQKSITIPSKFLQVLLSYKLHRENKDFYVFGKNGAPGPVHWGKNYFRFKFAKIRKDLDLPDFYKLYSFKHTGNVAAYDSGIGLSSLQQHNGHAHLTTTDKYMRRKGIRIDSDIRDNFPSI